MMTDRRRKNQGLTIRAEMVTGQSGPEASKREMTWDTPDGLNDKQLYSRLCDWGQRGGCEKCEVQCRFGEEFMARGLNEQRAKQQRRMGRILMIFPVIEKQLARMEMSVADLIQETGMSGEMLKRRLEGKKSFTLEEAISIKKALGLDMALEEIFSRA